MLIDVAQARLLSLPLIVTAIVVVIVIVAVMMSMTSVPAMPENVHQWTHQEQHIGQKLQRVIAMLDDYDMSQQRNKPPQRQPQPCAALRSIGFERGIGHHLAILVNQEWFNCTRTSAGLFALNQGSSLGSTMMPAPCLLTSWVGFVCA